jgi:hypothetical protein
MAPAARFCRFALQKLVTLLDLPGDAITIPNVSPEDNYVIQLAKHYNPKIHDVEMIETLSRRHSLTDHIGDTIDVDDQVLDDCFNAKDRMEALQSKAEGKQNKLRKIVKTHDIHAYVSNIPDLPKFIKPRGDIVKTKKTILKLSKKSGDRWWNKIVPEDDSISLLKPDSCHVFVDIKNGRYRVNHAHLIGSSKSFSWNKRPVHKAIAEALLQMWSWEQAYTGIACPLPREMIELAMVSN